MIGVFDSGLGGLSAVKELSLCLPKEDIVYFGDTGRVPYGTRSKNIIKKYAMQDARFLMRYKPGAILVACGTVSSVALPELRSLFHGPVIGVVEPAVKEALAATKNGKIAILGTPATVRSESYAELLTAREGIDVIGIPCPLFVPLVENGHIQPEDPIVKATVSHYLNKAVDFGADTIILGCTHYPLLRAAIRAYVGEDVALIDAAAAAAKELRRVLAEKEMLSEDGGKERFYVSDAPEDFAKTAEIFLGRSIERAVTEIDIDSY